MDMQALRAVDLFANLDPVQLAHLSSILEEQTFKKNELIFEEGTPSDRFFVIAKGRVRISKVVPGMGEEALAVLNTNAYFGEMELATPGVARVAQATAHEDCVLQTFTYDDFHTLLKADAELALSVLWGIVKTLSVRLSDTDNKVAATFAMAQFQ